MFFFLAVQLAGCIQYIVQVTSREFAIMVVFIVFGYIEIYRTLAFVCIAGIQNLFYQFYLFDDRPVRGACHFHHQKAVVSAKSAQRLPLQCDREEQRMNVRVLRK